MEIQIHKKPGMKKPKMLVGLPGMGMVAKNTVTTFIELLKPELFADIHVPYLSPSLALFEKGLVVPMERDESLFKFYFSSEKNMILFTGEMQFGLMTQDNELAQRIVEVAKQCDVDTIYTVIATHVEGYVEEPRVFGVATSRDLLDYLRSESVEIAAGSMQISGVNGLVIEYAQRMGIKGIALLSETAFPQTLDIKACYAGLKKASELLGIEVDLHIIQEEARKFEEGFKKYMKEMQKRKSSEEDLSYIG